MATHPDNRHPMGSPRPRARALPGIFVAVAAIVVALSSCSGTEAGGTEDEAAAVMEKLWSDWTDYELEFNASGLYSDDIISIFHPGAVGDEVHAQLEAFRRGNEAAGVRWTDIDCAATGEIDDLTNGVIVMCTAIEQSATGNSTPIEGTYAVRDGQNVRIMGWRRR